MQEQQSTINQDSSLWIGLDSYKESNSGIFFGRDEEIRQLSGDIFNNIQTVIYGPSGTGKTSIIRAGIFKIARANRYLPVYVRLNHKTDSKTYTQQIIDAIQDEAEKYSIDIEKTSPYIEENVLVTADENSKKKKVSLSLWEFFHCNEFWNEENYPVIPLIVVDQFEEIFTLGKNLSLQPDFFVQLSDLCDNKYPQYVIDYLNDRKNERIEYPETINYRFVISLREDFLARLEEQAETIPALKRNRFSLQCINEEQALDIILKPQPGLVSEDVAALIIEKVTNKKYNKDFKFHDDPEILVEPAILSLFCRELDKKRREKDMPTLSSELIGEFGDNIIKDFYINSLSSLSEGNEENNSPLPTRDEKIDYLESRLITVDGFRDAVAYQNAKAFGFTQKDIQTLISNRLVRIDEWDGTRRIEFIHDVLCKVANKHRKEREQERENKKKEEEAKRLLEKEKAKREKIAREAEEEKERLKEEAIRIRQRNRRKLYGVGIIVLFLILGIVSYLWYNVWERTSYYAQFERVNGWPVGIGDELSPEEMKQLPLYYKLSHKGRKDYDTDVEVCSSNGRLPRSPRIFSLVVCETDSDSRAKEYLNLLSQIKSIHFEAGEGDRLAKEVIKGENDSVLYYVNYFYLETKGQVWAQFVSTIGQAMSVRGNGLDRIKLSWYVSDDEDDWRNGRVTSMIYYDAQGVHQNGANGIFGYQIDYSDDRQSTTLYSLDKFGLPFEAPYNAVTTTRGKEDIETKYEHATCIPDSDRTPAKGPNGFWREVKERNMISYYNAGNDAPSAKCHITTDAQGNTKQLKMEGHVPHSLPTVIKYTYDDRTGYCTSEEKLNADNRPFYSSDSIYMKKWGYDDDGQLTLEEHYVTKDRMVYAHHITKKGNVVRDELQDKNNNENPILIRVDSIFERHSSSSYYGLNDTPINYKSIYEKIPYHRILTQRIGDERVTKYFRYDAVSGKELPQVVTKDSLYGIVYSFYCKKEELDIDGNVTSYQIFDKDGNIVKSMRYYYQNRQNIGRAVMGIEGTPVRCDKWEEGGFMYYKFYYNRDFDNMYCGLTAVDEWGHRSSTWDGNGYCYLYWLDLEGKWVRVYNTGEDMAENLNCISKTQVSHKYKQVILKDDPEQTDFEIPYIHILSPDSKFYNNKKGLRDGDRIVELGKWKLGLSKKLLQQEWESIMKNEGLVHIEVLRPIIDSYTYEKKSFNFKCSKNESELIEYHVLNMTKAEKIFLDNFFK